MIKPVFLFFITSFFPLFVVDLDAFAQNQPSESTFIHETFILKIPDGYVKDQLELPSLLASFRPNKGDFPSFNLIRLPYDQEISNATLDSHNKQIIESYLKSGLTNTQILSSKVIKIQEISVYSAATTYKFGDLRRYSFISIVPINSHKIILSVISDKSSFDLAKTLNQSLIDSFKVKNQNNVSKPSAIDSKNEYSNSLEKYLKVIILIIIVFIILYYSTFQKFLLKNF